MGGYGDQEMMSYERRFAGVPATLRGQSTTREALEERFGNVTSRLVLPPSRLTLLTPIGGELQALPVPSEPGLTLYQQGEAYLAYGCHACRDITLGMPIVEHALQGLNLDYFLYCHRPHCGELMYHIEH